MKVADLFEGAMKRSDPYVSGDREGAPAPAAPKKRKVDRFETMARKAGVSVAAVRSAWHAAKKEVDMSRTNAYAIVQRKVMDQLAAR
jgi:hypothetical protein